jgi:hypothetical protein
MMAALPVLAMSDRRDISGLLDSSNVVKTAVFLYDRYPGGLGFAQKGYELLDELLAMCRRIVTECPCTEAAHPAWDWPTFARPSPPTSGTAIRSPTRLPPGCCRQAGSGSLAAAPTGLNSHSYTGICPIMRRADAGLYPVTRQRSFRRGERTSGVALV